MMHPRLRRGLWDEVWRTMLLCGMSWVVLSWAIDLATHGGQGWW